MNLLAHSLWWLVPLFLIAGFMVYAMMEFTAALIVRRPRRRNKLASAELRARLLALNSPDRQWRVVEGGKADMDVTWDVVDQTWFELFARVKFSVVYRARMVLDETCHELRWFEIVRSSNVFLGFNGWKPRFNADFQMNFGYVNMLWRGVAYGILPGFPPRIGRVYAFELNTVAAKRDITAVVQKAGWTFRPAILPWQVNRRWIELTRRLTPSLLANVSRRWLWGSLYVGSFVLFFIYVFFGITDPETDWNAGNFAVAAGIAAMWWVIWALLTWLLLGLPGLKRRKR